MTFYLRPPRGHAHLHILEECVKERLSFYNNPSQNGSIIRNLICMVEDSSLDRSGHYILRLLAYKNVTFRYQFIEYECKLLETRLVCYDQLDMKYFLKRLLKQSKENLGDPDYSESSDKLKKVYAVLMNVSLQMMRQQYLNHVFDDEHKDGDICKTIAIHIRFEYCSSLIRNRDVILSNGYIEINCNQWKQLLISLYDNYLRLVLKEMKYTKSVKNVLNDDRIKCIINTIDVNAVVKGSYVANFNINHIGKKSMLFPLCMLNLYKLLETTNRLPHNERFDFSLFLKCVGLSMSDALKFWEKFYSKEHSASSKCTHSWKDNEKRYIYGVRHLYGMEGSRKNYSARSCRYLQENTLGPQDYGGCPFKHFDDIHLKRILQIQLPNKNDEVEMLINKRKENPTMSCNSLYSILYKQITNNIPSNFSVINPVDYYISLQTLEQYSEGDEM